MLQLALVRLETCEEERHQLSVEVSRLEAEISELREGSRLALEEAVERTRIEEQASSQEKVSVLAQAHAEQLRSLSEALEEQLASRQMAMEEGESGVCCCRLLLLLTAADCRCCCCC